MWTACVECSRFFAAQYACAGACFFFSSRRRHTRFDCDWSSDVCSSDLNYSNGETRELPIFYGQQVRDWFANSSSQSLDKNSVVAWSIKPPRDADNKTDRKSVV